MIQMSYKNKRGDLIRRTISTSSPYKIGDTNSFGWTVVDIKYSYKGKWFSKLDYDKRVDDSIRKMRRISLFKNKIATIYTNLGYLLELMIIMRVFSIISHSSM